MSQPARLVDLLPGTAQDLLNCSDRLNDLSPAVRAMVQAAANPGFARWSEQVRRTGGCSNPIHLVGESTMVRTGTGEVLHSYSTESEPGSLLLVPCGNRRASRCPACSEVYRADTYQLVRAGLVGGKSVPASVRSHPRVFATFTAPSFGPVHHRVLTPSGRARVCSSRGHIRCGQRHAEDDPALGTPLDPASYDYAGAVLWNALSSALWARWQIHVRRELAARAGVSQRDLARVLRLSFAKVAEYQRRGLVHFHAVIRLDGPLAGEVVGPPAWASVEVLEHAIRSAAERSVVLSPWSPSVGERRVTWGPQLDIRAIHSAAGPDDLSDSAVAAYVAKYATKGAEASGALDTSLVCRACRGTGMRDGGDVGDCRQCDGAGTSCDPDALRVPDHARRMIRTAWRLGGLAEFEPLRLRKWAHMLGFRGHFSSKSRRYSTTLGTLRAVRTDYRQTETHTRLGIADDDRVVTLKPGDELGDVEPGTIVILGHWRYAGHGYTDGQQPYADTIRDDLMASRRIARDLARQERGSS